jgi:hypothetical protein
MLESAQPAKAQATDTTSSTRMVALKELFLTAQAARARGLTLGYNLRVATFTLDDGQKVVIDLEYGHGTVAKESVPRLRRSIDKF